MAVAERRQLSLGRLGSVTFARGTSVSEKGSTFMAAIAYPIPTAAHGVAALAILRGLPIFATATHRINAYVALDGTVQCEDDGEAKAGGKLKSTLKKQKVKDVACLIGRWYGGVNIGKARFEHIAEVNSYTTTSPPPELQPLLPNVVLSLTLTHIHSLSLSLSRSLSLSLSLSVRSDAPPC
jgi:hypothetical protein